MRRGGLKKGYRWDCRLTDEGTSTAGHSDAGQAFEEDLSKPALDKTLQHPICGRNFRPPPHTSGHGIARWVGKLGKVGGQRVWGKPAGASRGAGEQGRKAARLQQHERQAARTVRMSLIAMLCHLHATCVRCPAWSEGKEALELACPQRDGTTGRRRTTKRCATETSILARPAPPGCIPPPPDVSDFETQDMRGWREAGGEERRKCTFLARAR